MKKVLFGIFAHPDDEAFGPSGTLYKESRSGTDVHLILVTDGASGNNNGHEDLAAVRLKEWELSAKMLGVCSHMALHYPDGSLSNSLYLKIATEITDHIEKTIASYKEPIAVDFMTFSQDGLSGHLDHIAVSYIATYVFESLRQRAPANASFGNLKYFCLPVTLAPQPSIEWIYMPVGKTNEELDEINDISDVYEKKLEIMKAYKSQEADMQMILSKHATHPDFKKEHFYYLKTSL